MNKKDAAPSILLIWGILMMLFATERLSKILAEQLISEDGLFLLKDSVGFIVEYNDGIAFSIPLIGAWLFAVISVIIFFLFWIHIRGAINKEKEVMWGTGLMIIGAFSNFIDRVRYESVIDFIRITRWPTFNLADIFVLCGVSILLLFYFQAKRVK